MKKYFAFLFFCCALFFCENNNDLQEKEKTLLIASTKVDCVGLGPQKCLLIKENNQGSWEYLYDSIIGFVYEKGFEYEVLVSEKQIQNPPQDASSIELTLIKIVSKVQKTSENLPN